MRSPPKTKVSFARVASYNHDNIHVNKKTCWAYTATSVVQVSSYRFRHQNFKKKIDQEIQFFSAQWPKFVLCS